MKAFTSLEQSKKLAEILPIESADMRFCFSHTLDGRVIGHYPMIGREPSMGTVPCWSLSALLDVLPKEYYPVKDHKTDLILGKPKDKWCVLYWDTTGMQHGIETLGDNPVDACVEMIIKLKEKDLL